MPTDDDGRHHREHFVTTMHKDLQAAIEAAEKLGVEVDLARFVDERFESLIPIA
jgi:hypothetical protein